MTFDTLAVSSNSAHTGIVGGVAVNEMQTVVVRWMDRQLNRLRWSAERWAREANLSPTTVTRAMSPSYNSVSSVPTLEALARAAGVPSVIDFLDGQSFGFNYPILTVMLTELLPAVGCKLDDETTALLGECLGQSICGMLEQPAAMRENPDLARALARAARGRLLYRRGE